MGKPYSQDLRERVIADVEGGMSARAAGRKWRISASAAIRYVQSWRSRGHCLPAKQGAPEGSVLDDHRKWLCEQIKDQNDKTIEQIRSLLKERGVKVGYGTLWDYLDKLGYSYKKNRSRNRTGT